MCHRFWVQGYNKWSFYEQQKSYITNFWNGHSTTQPEFYLFKVKQQKH